MSAGQDVSTTDFERIGGRASSKKWKQSVRVINDDGTAGKLIGDWLTVCLPSSWSPKSSLPACCQKGPEQASASVRFAMQDRGLDIKNNKVIKLDDLSLASQDSSVVRKASVQPHSPVDVRRELATPVNSKMHTVFSGSKPMVKEQVLPTLQHRSQSQSSLQHQQQHANPEFSPTAPAATLSYSPVHQHSMQGPAQGQSCQAQGASSGSVAALPKPPQAHSTGLCIVDAAHLQATVQGPPSTPPRCLPAQEHPGTSPQWPLGLQTQDPQCSAEAVVLAGPLVAPQHMPVPTVPTRPPALALAVQSCSASQQVPKLAPTSPLTAAAEAYTVQQMQQEPTQRSQADVRSATQQVSKQKLPKRMLTHVPQLQPTEASGTDLLQHLQLS